MHRALHIFICIIKENMHTMLICNNIMNIGYKTFLLIHTLPINVYQIRAFIHLSTEHYTLIYQIIHNALVLDLFFFIQNLIKILSVLHHDNKYVHVSSGMTLLETCMSITRNPSNLKFLFWSLFWLNNFLTLEAGRIR